MSGEDSKQLSVAELLARNAAQGAAPPSGGGGGRRRRSGRGLSVTDLTGENATVRSGPSSHAAPTPEPAAAPEPAPTYAPEPASYEPPASYQPAPYPPPGPAEPVFSPVSGPITRFDPNSRFSAPDPLAPASSDPFGPYRAEARDSGTRANGRGPDRLGAPGTGAQPVDPGIAELFGSGAIPAVPGSGGGRRRKPDPEEEQTPFPEPPPATGGRAARRRAAEAAEDAAEPWSPAPGYGPNGYDAFGPADAPQAFNGTGTADPLSSFNGRGVDPGQGRNGAPGRNGGPAADRATGFNGFPGAEPAAGFNGFPGAEPASGFNGFPGTESSGLNGFEPGGGLNGFPGGEPAAGFNGYPGADRAPGFNGFPAPASDATQAFNRAPGADAPAPDDQRPSLERRRSSGKSGGLPSWSARRHRPESKAPAPESGGFATAAWSPVSQEQPLVAGQSVAGDLLRRQADQGADARTEVYRVGDKRGGDPDTDDYAESDYVDRDYADNDYSDADYADGEYDDTEYDDYDDDYETEPKPTRASRRAATKAAASKVARRAKSRAARGMAGGMALSRLKRGGDTDESPRRESGSRSLGRVSRLTGGGSAESDNRRQWLILAGQSAGAAVAGMLLFKGFETLWETMHWVALALAMVVILGLVALVRVLRRTDDIFSTVIAVVVGVFVTLGPLAFLLSTS
ncbi:hypothetical protein ACFVVM_14875 [Nocardia sp. NPDC058176]|uniref:hypothetical protein n=1 Tax=Nocardia sp. NPDC058176 TaxID=3346368 RepID=UPI0036DC10A7